MKTLGRLGLLCSLKLKLPSINLGGRTKESQSLRQDWSFEDGSGPPEQVVEDWLNLLQAKFRDEAGSCVAVHCTSGLGR